jgi:hypothetical protein
MPVVKCLVETPANCNRLALTCPDVFLVLKNEGVGKFQTSWQVLLRPTRAELDTADGTRHRCRAGEFGWERK